MAVPQHHGSQHVTTEAPLMRAVLRDTYGPPDVVRLAQVPRPAPVPLRSSSGCGPRVWTAGSGTS